MSVKSHSEQNPPASGINELRAREIFAMSEQEFLETILPLTKQCRETHFGNEISFCSIVNAKSGACVEDCSFCSQSNSYKGAQAPLYPLMSSEKIFEAAKEAEAFGATEFSIVTSGTGMSKQKELDTMVNAITKIRQETQMETCASLGLEFLSNNAFPDMICPGVQKPHCGPSCSINASCSGSSFSPLASPSMVVMSLPSIQTASWLHE